MEDFKLIGHKVITFDEVSSTNDLAKEFCNEVDSNGIVILANKQNKGRGRFERRWHSSDIGGVYLSIILAATLINFDPKLLPLIAAYAVSKTIEQISDIKTFIKWPNDVIVNNKKVSGVLVEKYKNFYIVGIGVNLNNRKENFPIDIKEKATSLFIEGGKVYNKEIFLKDFFSSFESVLESFNSLDLIKEIKKKSYTLGKNVNIKVADKNIFGKVIDFANDGSLLIESTDGKIEYINSGEIVDVN